MILIGDFHAIRHRPIIINETHLLFRLGVRWSAKIPIDQIESIEADRKIVKKARHANFLSFGSPNTIIHLKTECNAIGIYGIQKKFTSFSIFVDDPITFKNELHGKTKLDKNS